MLSSLGCVGIDCERGEPEGGFTVVHFIRLSRICMCRHPYPGQWYPPTQSLSRRLFPLVSVRPDFPKTALVVLFHFLVRILPQISGASFCALPAKSWASPGQPRRPGRVERSADHQTLERLRADREPVRLLGLLQANQDRCTCCGGELIIIRCIGIIRPGISRLPCGARCHIRWPLGEGRPAAALRWASSSPYDFYHYIHELLASSIMQIGSLVTDCTGFLPRLVPG